jgi:hypothetical protein
MAISEFSSDSSEVSVDAQYPKKQDPTEDIALISYETLREPDRPVDPSLIDKPDFDWNRPNDAPADEAGDARADGYDRQAAAREDLRALVGALDEVTRLLADMLRRQSYAGLVESADLEEQAVLAERIMPEVRQLAGTARELVARGPDQKPDMAFSAAAQMTALGSEVRYARKRYTANMVWSKIWATLKRVAPRLWSLISHLVKVKEWSVTGQVGTGVLGLAQASISVTFG